MRTPPSQTPYLRRVAVLLACSLASCGGGGGQPAALHSGDLDQDGIPDDRDNDLDGDGSLNQFDSNVDGDLLANHLDRDADGDEVLNEDDDSPYGPWFPNPVTARVTDGQTTLNFGDVPLGQSAGPGEASIQNDTITPYTCTRVALVGSAGGAFTLDPSTLPGGGAPFSLPVGGTATFRVSFRPANHGAHLGRVEVDLRDSSSTQFTMVVHLLGMTPAPPLTPNGGGQSVNFGDVPVGVTAGPAVATVRNDTAFAYMVSRVALVGTGGGTFALDLSPLPGGAVPFTLDTNEEAAFHVRYTPNAGVPNVGRAEVDFQGPGGTFTVALDLFGQGIAPAISIVPRPVDMGTALSGAMTSRVAVEIRNEFFATGDLVVDAIDFADDLGGDLTLESVSLPFTIAPGGPPVTAFVRYSPSASPLGARQGALRVHGNDPNGDVDQVVAVLGRAAGWTSPASPVATDLTLPSGPDSARPVRLANTRRAVVRSAGPNGVFGGALSSDDQIVVVDADPDGDPATNDARVIVRWSGFHLSPAPAGRPVDAGNGLHVFFLDGGLDGMLGTGDDTIRVLDTVSGTSRSLACPAAGSRKSRPVIVDPGTSRVVVATGVGGGILGSTDTLLVYENLLGDLGAVGPSDTIALGVVVPDLVACEPVVVAPDAVVMPAADAEGSADPSDRRLDDGDEGIVQAIGLGGTVDVHVIPLDRALAESEEPADGDAFSRPVVSGGGSILVATEGASAAVTTDDEVVRLDGAGTAGFAVAASVATGDLSGLASRPVPAGGATFVLAAPGPDGAYGTGDDRLVNVTATGAMSSADFGPGGALGGDGGAGSAPVVFGAGVLVPHAGPNAILGDSDDALVHVNPALSGATSVIGRLPIPGGMVVSTRATDTSACGAAILDVRFVLVADRGADGLDASGDEVFRVFYDRDGSGRLGEASDDLDLDGSFGASDAVVLSIGRIDGDHTPVLSLGDGHFLTLEPGPDGSFGTGEDDGITVRWLQESVTLP